MKIFLTAFFFLTIGLIFIINPSLTFASTTCGFNGSALGTDSGLNNTNIGVVACIPPVDSTVNSAVISVNSTAGGSVAVAVYLIDPASNVTVHSPLCTSSGQAAVVGDNTISLSGCGTLTAGKAYAIVVNDDTASLTVNRDSTKPSSGCGTNPLVSIIQNGNTYPSFASSGLNWAAVSVCNYRFWLNITPVSSPTPTPTPSPTPSPTPTPNPSGTNFYISQNGSGSQDASSCANTLPILFFNTSSNWGSGTGKIGPGVTVHLCGMITSQLIFQGDGISGNPITILFESGARLSTAGGYSNGFIYGGASRNWITIDGGGNGIIESTNNGSSPTYQNQVDAGGVYFPTCNNCIVRNLTVQNLFIKNTSDSQGGGDAIDIHGGSNNSIYGNTVHDTQIGIYVPFGGGGESNDQIYNNTVYHFNHAIASGDTSDGAVSNNLSVHDNNIYDAYMWDDLNNNAFHHNGVFLFCHQSQQQD